MTNEQKAPLCTTCGTKMRLAGSCFICEGCGSTAAMHSMKTPKVRTVAEPSQAYLDIQTQKAALGDQLFELMVQNNWFGALSVSLRDYDESRNWDYTYFSEPKLVGHHGRHYLGGYELTHDARKLKEVALGDKIDDVRLKSLVEEVLHDELEKYGIVLQWCTRYVRDGVDRVLYMYRKPEEVPPAT